MAFLPTFLILPLKDNLKARKLPFVTCSLIGLSILTCIYQFFFIQPGMCPLPTTINEANLLTRLAESCITSGAVIPADILAAFASGELLRIITSLTTMTGAMFVHESWHYAGEWQHLVFNMILIFAFGPALEARLGRIGLLALYFATSATSFFSIVLIGITAQMFGASGAAFGLMGAYLALFPAARMVAAVLIPMPQWRLSSLGIPAFMPIPFVLKAAWLIPTYLVWSFIFAGSNLTIVAHFTAFMAGYVIAWSLLRSNMLVPIAQAFVTAQVDSKTREY